MDSYNLHWMNYSIDIAGGVPQSDLRVGVVLVSENNTLICSAFSGEERNATWKSVLLSKIRKIKVINAQSVYLTINTWSAIHSFDLIELLNEICVDEIYVGLPDATLTSYFDNDPIVALKYVYRYPDELQRKILEQNNQFYVDSKQSIKHSPYYSENRISDLVIQNLKSKGFVIFKDELNENKTRAALASLISDKHRIEYSDAISAVHNVISEAFNKKYGAYSYSHDTRSLDLDWKDSFMSLYTKLSERPISTVKMLNVGVASGHEAIALFSDCKYATFIDIAPDGLKKVQEQIPLSKIIVSCATNLAFIPDSSHELYVSLRTYNSSFFDIKEAMSEAHRVLKPNALMIISVANGFLCPERSCSIPGLIIPGTKFVDIYRGMDVAKLIHTEFVQAGFNDIKIFPTNTEIYLSAINNAS